MIIIARHTLSKVAVFFLPTAPSVWFRGVNLPNHSYVDLSLVGDARNGSDSVQCHTDLETCCHREQGEDRGDWYAPGSSSRLPFPRTPETKIFESRETQRVDLRRREHGNTTIMSGIYRCRIETIDSTTREKVYVGLYDDSGGEFIIIIDNYARLILSIAII